jgi:hypothetical protein
MIIVKPEGAAPCCRSEREFLRAVHDQSGIYIANVNVPNSTTPGAFTREVDGVMLSPHGIYTVEVKGIRATGELHTPRMDGWSIVDGDTKVPLQGRPHAQALAHSKYLASFLKDTGVAPGWIRAVLAIVGENITLADAADVVVVDNVYVVISQPGVGDIMRQQIAGTISQRELSVEMVQKILTTFECVDSAPTFDELIAEGFRTEAEIAAEVEIKRQQVRDEFLAATAAATDEPAHTETDPTAVESPTIADSPSTVEWKITQERYAAAVALDDELTETGAFVDGVPMHKRLISYAERKGVSLTDVAAVVNNPVEVLGDDTDTNLVYCGEHFAVSVRALDGLAMFYKPVATAKAERQGAVINGQEITARAAKQAINQFSITLEAVVRIISEPEEKWWVPGTTDIAHARGEFVAVTSGPLGPVQYVQTRAMAVNRSAPKPVEDKAPVTITDVVMDGITIKASAVGWCNRRSVALESIVETVLRPQHTWAGHSSNMEVRSGETSAVLLDVSEQMVVAVMTTAEAVEYRDGIVKEGVRLSGRCVFLAKRRKVSVDDLTSAYLNPLTIAREPGSSESVYIGSELAVTVEDETHAVVDFTFAGHARSRIRRQELVAVDLNEPESVSVDETYTPVVRAVPSQVPSPAMFAKSIHPPARRSTPAAVSPLVMAGRQRTA